MNSEADLFAGFEVVDKTNDFDPLKAQFRRAEIYKRALEMAVRDHNHWVEEEYSIDMVQYDKEDIDNYISIAKTEVDNGK
jgi:hypothetical protein